MASLLRKRKGKAAASSSEAPRFKTLYHESHFNNFFAAREVLPESRIKIDDDALSPISAQINLRKWQRLTKPFLMVGYSLVREFYANTWRLEEHKNQPPTYMMHGHLSSYHDRKANNNLRLDEVLAYLCVEGAQWVRHLDGRPHFLRRIGLQPMARGWYEFVCRSIMPTTNRSEVNVERAMLIHAIIIGEDIQVDEIIAEQMYKFVNKTNTQSKLPFPSVIALLCKEAKVTIPGDTLIPQEDPIDGVAMGRVRGPREPRQNQEVEEEAPQQQPQQFQQQQNFPPDFMANFNNTMATIQQHYDQTWDTLQQKFDDAQEEIRRNFGAINQRMNQMDDQLSFLCYSHQLANESMLFPYQNTTRQMREIEQQGIPITIANLNIHRTREEEMRQERMRYEKILGEAAVQKAKEQNKSIARGVEEDYNDEETVDEGGEW
ncbi:hypothetical protein PIB30_066651 [Stylosanthes scabra]|uniref:Putative plant transposon protein domain-containing protein n=1 Tax=Stylosanthes scabra TaxID=79078 RepID=A0ABU6RNF7_9FABA|nr:hypothetical protein [Stylosanthes scabra]